MTRPIKAALFLLVTFPTCGNDSNGNLISMNGGDENQLVLLSSNNMAGGYTASQTLLAYDGKLRLRLRVERSNNSIGCGGGGMAFGDGVHANAGGGTASWITSSTTEYVYDGIRVTQERDGSNVPLVSYTRGTDLSGTLEGAGGIGGLLARSHSYSSGNWSTHNFYHADGNGIQIHNGTTCTIRCDKDGNPKDIECHKRALAGPDPTPNSPDLPPNPFQSK